MSSRPRVLVAEPDAFDRDAHDLLARHAEVVLERPADLRAAFTSFDAVWVRLGFRVTAADVGAAPRARVLACPATGLDHLDLEACKAAGVRVVSLKGEVEFLRRVCATAELTMALMLALYRKLPRAAESVLAGAWDRDRFRGRELSEKTLGLVGVGRLGALVARMAEGFGMRVIGYDVRDDFPAGVERVATIGELAEESDILSLHVSYDASTRKLVDRDVIARLRPGAVVINTSRGGVLDEVALLSALERGAIAGAALDVMDGEPCPGLADHPLVVYARAHDNLIIVPHIGGNTWESTRKTELFIAGRVLSALGLAEGGAS